MKFDDLFAEIPPQKGHAVLEELMRKFCEPAFGALPKREIELAFFEAMRELEIIPRDASLYQLMSDLRITRSKANALLFDIDVRRMGDDEDKLNEEIRKALIGTRLAKDGDYFVLEVENPLVNAHLKEKVRKMKYVSDSSFNAALIRLPCDAVTELIAEVVPPGRRELVRKALIKAGATDHSLKGMLKSALSKLGEKVVGKAAEGLADDAVEFGAKFLEPLFNQAGSAITGVWKALLADSK